MKSISILIAVFVMAISMVTAASVEPWLYQGNVNECEDIGDYDNELVIDPPVSGDYGGITFALNGDSKYFNWSSSFPIDAVVAKGGNNAYVYDYNPAATGDTNLVSPLNNGGQVPELSHAVFCWNDREPNNDVPEFTTLAAFGLLGAAGYIVYKKRK